MDILTYKDHDIYPDGNACPALGQGQKCGWVKPTSAIPKLYMVEKLKQNIKNILMSQGMFLSFEKREVLDLELKGYLLHVHNRGHTRCTCMYKKMFGWEEEYI